MFFICRAFSTFSRSSGSRRQLLLLHVCGIGVVLMLEEYGKVLHPSSLYSIPHDMRRNQSIAFNLAAVMRVFFVNNLQVSDFPHICSRTQRSPDAFASFTQLKRTSHFEPSYKFLVKKILQPQLSQTPHQQPTPAPPPPTPRRGSRCERGTVHPPSRGTSRVRQSPAAPAPTTANTGRAPT